MTPRPQAPRRAGFTLIEVLIVIAIIAILMGLLLPAIQRIRISAQYAQCSSDIAQLSNAIATFKQKFNVDYLPAGNPDNSKFRLLPSYAATDPEAVYLKQLFPQMNLSNTGITAATAAELDANQCLVFFLTGGQATNYQGFSSNKAAPFSGVMANGEQRIGPFIELSANKINGSGQYVDVWGKPYVYYTSIPNAGVGTYFGVSGGSNNGVKAYYTVSGNIYKYFNAKSFQIISAGVDGQFGPGGENWTPGAGSYATGRVGGADDLSNFNAGKLVTRE